MIDKFSESGRKIHSGHVIHHRKLFISHRVKGLQNQVARLVISGCPCRSRAMARGQQKIQAQQKNAKKASEKKKGQGADQKTAAKAALVHTCPVCKVSGPACRGSEWGVISPLL